MEDQTIGVLGGGQLGRMMVQAALRLGLQVITLDKEKSPASQVSNPINMIQGGGDHQVEINHQIGSFNSKEDIERFTKLVKILTIEIEHVNVSILQTVLEKQKSLSTNSHQIKIYPHPDVIKVIQDKLIQKNHLSQHKVSVPDFEPIPPVSSGDHLKLELEKIGEKFGYPFMLKKRMLAYDGRGNYLVKSSDQIPDAGEVMAPGSTGTSWQSSIDFQLYAERFVPFVCEIAVMVVKGVPRPDYNSSDMMNIRVYPPVQTIHENSICHIVYSPLRLGGPAVSKAASDLAQEAIIALGPGAIGVFAVEMFLLPDNSLLVNEIAPRPHNSYHHTISSTPVSQFTAHLLAITSKQLPPQESFELAVPSAAMVNILGHESGEEGERQIKKCVELVTGLPGVSIELYGKFGCQRGRKMGHINVVGQSDAEVREIVAKVVRCLPANQSQASLTSPMDNSLSYSPGFSHPNPLVSIIMGSDSDLPTMIEASRILSDPLFQIPHELTIVSAHRTPQRMVEFSKAASSRGIKVIIAGAGGAAHLPGMVSALTPLPVIGVPVKGKTLDGVDSLYSIVQMPRGIPVATVAIGNSTNAALLAIRILSVGQPRLVKAMEAYMAKMETEVMTKVDKLQQVGWESYLGPSAS